MPHHTDWQEAQDEISSRSEETRELTALLSTAREVLIEVEKFLCGASIYDEEEMSEQVKEALKETG